TRLQGCRNLSGVTRDPNRTLCKRLEPYSIVQRFPCFGSQQVEQIGPPLSMISDGVFQYSPARAFALELTWGCHRPNSNSWAGARRRNRTNWSAIMTCNEDANLRSVEEQWPKGPTDRLQRKIKGASRQII